MGHQRKHIYNFKFKLDSKGFATDVLLDSKWGWCGLTLILSVTRFRLLYIHLNYIQMLILYIQNKTSSFIGRTKSMLFIIRAIVHKYDDLKFKLTPKARKFKTGKNRIWISIYFCEVDYLELLIFCIVENSKYKICIRIQRLKYFYV